MLVYIFDKTTGEFLKEYSPQINPKRPDEYIMPSNATSIKPNQKEGFVSVFDGSKWSFKNDYRNCEIINPDTNEKIIVKTLGNLPEGFILYEDYKLTDEYINKQIEKQNEMQKMQIINQIEELDIKRIRALCEPEQKTESQSWLEYYTEQIIELRKQLQEL